MLRQLGAAPLARGRFAVTPSTQAIRTLSCSSPARADDATTPSPAAGDSAAPTEPAQPKLLFRKIYTKERRADQKADKKADEETDKLAAAQRDCHMAEMT